MKIKSVVSLVLICVMCVTALPIYTVAATPEQTANVQDFENYTVGDLLKFPWVVTDITPQIDPTDDENMTLKIGSSGTYSFDRTTTETTVSVDLLFATVGSFSFEVFGDDYIADVVADITTDEQGAFYYTNGDETVAAGVTATANEWITVALTINAASHKYSLVINDLSVASDIDFSNTGYSCRHIAGVSFATTSAVTYIDKLTTPMTNIEVLEKYVPNYKELQILTDQNNYTDGMLYCGFPSIDWVSDTDILISFQRGEKHAFSHTVTMLMRYNTVTKQVVWEKVMNDGGVMSSGSGQVLTMPNGDTILNYDTKSADWDSVHYGNYQLRSTDGFETYTGPSEVLKDSDGRTMGFVYDSWNEGNTAYILSQYMFSVSYEQHDKLGKVCILKSDDNGKTWDLVKDITDELDYELNESSIVPYGDGYLLVARCDNKVTKLTKLDKNFNVVFDRNLRLDYNCIGHVGLPRLFEKDGEYYITTRNILPDSENRMICTLHKVDPDTLEILSYVELEPANVGTNGGDGFYTATYFVEENGVEYLNVITYSLAYSDFAKPQIIRLEYVWDEIKNLGVDNEAPAISAVEQGKTYYTTQHAVVKDTYLESVELNGADVTQKTTITGNQNTVALTFDKDEYNYQTIANAAGRGVLGICSGTDAGARIFSRPEGVNGTGAIKWSSSTMNSGVMLARDNIAGSGLGFAYVLEPDTEYTVEYYFKNSTSGITVNFMATENYTDVEGTVLASKTYTGTDSSFVKRTATFTTPSRKELGNDIYLSFVITKPSTISTYTALLDNVTITSKPVDKTIVNKKQSITLEGNKTATYNIVATDASNNSTSMTVYMKPIATIDQATNELTISNVTEDDREVILEAKAKAEAIDLTCATESEKAEVTALIDKYTKLIKKLDGTLCEEHIYDNVLDTECNNCGHVREKHVGKTLVKIEGVWYYVVDGELSNETTLVKYNGVYYYVKNGVKCTDNTLVKYNSKWYHVNGGQWVKDTTLVKYNGVYYYVKNGVKTADTTLVKYNSKWYYVKNGVYTKETTLVKYTDGNYYYVKNGVKNTTDNTLVKYNDKWYHVKGGKWVKDTALVKYCCLYYYVKDGIKTSATTIVEHDGKWYYVRNGKWMENTTLVKYGGKWYYVEDGFVNFKYNGPAVYKGVIYTIKNGIKV